MYLVIEIQKNNGVVSTMVNSYDSRNAAENKYHEILAYAAISTVDIHTAVMLSDLGFYIKSESFDHITE